ncbi:STAS domain-containing protein [Streptomyces sp. NPDC001073]|uniref:STAS domain-containing protein n=1 Tax=Streptomyces sp. NPDC001642 TaxID=3154392 RepID=UPI00331DCDA4
MTDELPARPGHLTVHHSTLDGVRIVALRGELDHAARDFAEEALRPPAGGTPRTVADLTELTFMDSSGINALIAAHRAAVDAQGWLRVAGTRPSVLRVLQIVGVDTLISCVPTVRQAVEE